MDVIYTSFGALDGSWIPVDMIMLGLVLYGINYSTAPYIPMSLRVVLMAMAVVLSGALETVMSLAFLLFASILIMYMVMVLWFNEGRAKIFLFYLSLYILIEVASDGAISGLVLSKV